MSSQRSSADGGGKRISGSNSMRNLLDSLLSPKGREEPEAKLSKRDTDPLKGWMEGLMPGRQSAGAGKPAPAQLASRITGSAAPEQRPASVAFRSLSEMLETPRPGSSAQAPADMAARQPPCRPNSKDAAERQRPEQQAALSPRSPEDELRISEQVEQHPRGDATTPVQPWAVYSPINEQEQTGELSPKPLLSMSHRRATCEGSSDGSQGQQIHWVGDEYSPEYRPNSQGEKDDGMEKQVKAMRRRINELEEEIAAAHFAAGQGLNTVTRRGELKIKNLSLRHLPRVDMFGKCDPVVELNIGKQRRRTRKRSGCFDASFEDEVLSFRFPCPDSELCMGLTCQVWDTNRSQGDKIIGKAHLELMSVANGPTGSYTHRMKTTLSRDGNADGNRVVGHDLQDTEVFMEVLWESSLGDDEGLQAVLKRASEASRHISALNMVIAQSESQMNYLQTSDAEKSSKIAQLEHALQQEGEWRAKALDAQQRATQSEEALQLCNKKLEALTAVAESALEVNAHGEHQEVYQMYEEKAKMGSTLAVLLSELIEAKLEVRQIISREKAVQSRCSHLELELVGVRSQLRESFVGYHKEASELDAELATALEAKEQLEQCVAELSAQIDELKLQNLKQQSHQKAFAAPDTQAQAKVESLHTRVHQQVQSNTPLQDQNKLLNKQMNKLKEENATLLLEVERLSHLEQNLRALQRDHDDLHKVHAESQKQINEIATSQARTPNSAAILQASFNTSALDETPQDYVLGMNIASKDSGMTVKSFAPGSVCAGILRSGDQLLSIAGRRIKDVKHLRQICRGVPGTIVSIKYTRKPSDEVLEMQLVRASNSQGQPVFREYIPCTPRAAPPSAATQGGNTEATLKMLEKKWERQIEEVLQAKAKNQKELSAAINDMRAAQQEADKALNLLNEVQEELAQAKESEAKALKEAAQARSELQTADALVRRLQDDRDLATEERQVLEREKLALLSKLTLLQAKLDIAVKSSTGVSSSLADGAEEALGNEALEAGSQQVSTLIAEKDVLVEASKRKTREIDALQGKLFAAEAHLREETQRAQVLEVQLQKATADRGAWEETFAAQEKQINHLLHLTGQQSAEADGVATKLIKELEGQVKTLSEELQACNDLLEQEWLKTTEQEAVMASLAADVSQWQARYEELEARGIDNMFDRTSTDPAKTSKAPEVARPEEVEAQVQEQVASALSSAMLRLSALEAEKKRLQSEVVQAKLDRDVLDKGLDEAMKEMRQHSQQLAVARDLAAEARDLAAQESLRAQNAERKLEQESKKLRAAQIDLSRLSMSNSQTDSSRASAATSVTAPTRSASNSPVNNPVTLF